MIPAAPLLAHAHFENLTPFEWGIVGLAALVAAWTIWKAVGYALRPGEDDPAHIKRLILLPDATQPARDPRPERPS